MGLRQWRYFAVLAEEMSFTRAARRLYIAQPALSQQIKRFEGDLGVRLLERRGRTFELTEAGRVAAAEAAELVGHAQAARDRVVAAGQGRAGVLRLAYTRSAPGGPTSAVVALYRESHPEVDIRLVTAWTTHNVRELVAGRIDAAFVRPPVEAAGIGCRVLATEELLLAVAQEHPLARRRRIRVAQLRQEPVVHWPRANGPGMHDLIGAQVWPDGPPRVVREEPDDEQLLHAVAAGVGIAVVPSGRARALRVPGVALRSFADPAPVVHLGLAYREDASNPSLPPLLHAAEQVARLNRV